MWVVYLLLGVCVVSAKASEMNDINVLLDETQKDITQLTNELLVLEDDQDNGSETDAEAVAEATYFADLQNGMNVSANATGEAIDDEEGAKYAKDAASADAAEVQEDSIEAVEGCFKKFVEAEKKDLGSSNSNGACQKHCRNLGYILAATQQHHCHCGNIYPAGQEANDTECNAQCRHYTKCNSPQSCCGGRFRFSISVVGDIDVAKMALARLAHQWRENSGYRKHMQNGIGVSSPKTNNANWWRSFDKKGLSKCPDKRFMTGMYRNVNGGKNDGIWKLEEAKCQEAQKYLHATNADCYMHNWWGSFDRKGWSTCRNGYYMSGLWRNTCPWIWCIEEARCCKPRTQKPKWGSCYTQNIWKSFDNKGWSSCRAGYYMAGLWRNSCSKLYCIENIKCCQMGPYDGNSFIEKPTFSIQIQDVAGQRKKCEMKGNDVKGSTYKCKLTPKETPTLDMKAKTFSIEDQTELNVAKPRPIDGFTPIQCLPRGTVYTCSKTVTTTVSKTSRFTIGAGFSLAVSVTAGVEVTGKVPLVAETKASLSTTIAASASMSVSHSTTKSFSRADSTSVSVDVPIGQEVKINLMRTKQDLVYKWKAVFQLLGRYTVRWDNGQQKTEDITTVLTGPDRVLYAFGKWEYPGTDFITVLVTDKFGKKKEGCKHEPGQTTCKV